MTTNNSKYKPGDLVALTSSMIRNMGIVINVSRMNATAISSSKHCSHLQDLYPFTYYVYFTDGTGYVGPLLSDALVMVNAAPR